MRFVAISDTHCRHRSLRLPKGDVLLHAGDISCKGRKDEMIDFLEWFGRQPFAHKIFIGGNHDFYLEAAPPADIEALLPEGVTYLNDSGTTVNGLSVWGSPFTPWFHNWAFNRHRGEPIRKHWERIPAGTDVLLTHGPVYGFLDDTLNERNAGCKDLLRTVLTLQPKVHVFGHIHEAYGTLTRSGIKFINAALANEQYELVNKPVVFDL